MFSKPKQESGAQKRKKRKEQDEGRAKMMKLDNFFTPTQATQAKASIPLEASGNLPASSTNEAAAALTLPPRPASPGGQKETSPPPQPQRSELADSAVPTSGPVAGTTLPTDRGLYDIALPPDIKTKSYIIATGSCRPTGPFPQRQKARKQVFLPKHTTPPLPRQVSNSRDHGCVICLHWTVPIVSRAVCLQTEVHLSTVMHGSKE